jgi:glycosyltransferase involved in cell wall biosynthesis
MEAVAVRLPDRTIADAVAIRTHLARRHARTVDCQVIEYGADIVSQPPDTRALAEFSVEPGRYFLVICRLEPENHVMEIVHGYVKSKSGLSLLIVGDGLPNSEYVRRLKEVSDARVRFVGAVYDRTKLRTLRFHCKAYLHGHSVGGTNPSLLEALGCGCVVIAHDNPFNREVCEDVAWYFQHEDEIPEAISVIDSYDTMTRAEITRNARSRIRDRYSWRRITDRYMELLNGGSSPVV